LGAAGLLVLAVGAWTVDRFTDPVSPPPELTEPPERTPVPPVARVEPPSPPPVKAPPPARTPPPRAEAPPAPAPGAAPADAAPPAEAVSADPFEPEEGKDPHIRTLVSVGDIQLGVVRESARIRDEAGLKQVLVRIGGDLEKRVQEQEKQGVSGLQQVLDDYREELGKHMDGEVELRGPGWMIGTEVGPPLPREQWWKQRAQ
jgi:hypothetical protein